jgi:2-desacetyl-2-hydroxyethyl bacteriochlorophyllide A dehydrogenase
MKAWVLQAPGRLEHREVRDPVPAPGAVLVRVSHTGICGTDLKIVAGTMPGRRPVVVGHEIVGEVVGGDARGPLAPGARVLVDPTLSCGACAECAEGRPYLCPGGALMGREVDGGFAELVAAPAANCHVLPGTVDPAQGPLIQVLTTVHHAQVVAGVAAGETVVVLGLGVSGLLHVQLARARGARCVVGVSRNADKRRLAVALGADVAADHGEEARRAVREASGGAGADVVIESVGALPVLAEAMELVRAAGRIVPFGIYAEQEARLPFQQLYLKELRIVAARAAAPSDFAASIALADDGRVRLAPLISDVLPLAELDQAFARMADRRRLKIILRG